MRRVRHLCLGLIVLPALTTLGGCSWFTGLFSPSAPKVKPAELVAFEATATLAKGWDINVGAGRPYSFSPASDGQALYAAGREGRILKIDPASGREVGRIDTGKPLSAGVGVGEGLVLVGTAKGEVLAYRGADGQPAWSATLSGEILNAPVAGYGVVAARSNNGKVYLLDARDGKQRWVYSSTQPSLTLREPGGLVLTERAVLAGYAGGKLTALSLANGGPVWEVNVALPKGANELERIADVSGALAADGDLVCATAYQGRIACFNALSGTPVWGRDFSALRGAALDKRMVYAADESATVQSFDRQRGTSPWKQDKLRDRALSTPLALGRYVAVGDYQGYIHLLDADTGAFAARIATDGSAIVGTLLAHGQGLVVQTANGGVYAFSVQEAGIRKQ